MKRAYIIIMILLCSARFVLTPAVEVNISGTVTKTGGVALKGVIVTLGKISGLSATTDSLGKFKLAGSVNTLHMNSPQVTPLEFMVKDNAVFFSQVSGKIKGCVDVFSGNGRKLTSQHFANLQPGKQSITLPAFSSGLNIVRITIGNKTYSCQLVRLGNDMYLKHEISNAKTDGNFMLAKQTGAAVKDTLIAKKTGFSDKKTSVESYVIATDLAISMDSNTTTTAKCTLSAKMPKVSELTANAKMPDPFKFMNGTRMTKKSDWICRREEIKALAQEFIYGTKPPKPEKVEASLSGSKLTITSTHNGKSGSFAITLSGVPSGTGPFPLFIYFGTTALMSLPAGIASTTIPEQTISSEANPRPPAGVFNTLYPEVKDNTGSLIGWAWGISRIIDAFEITPEAKIDPKKIAIMGCSRWGKGAGMGAFDDRVALIVAESPGSGFTSTWRVAESVTDKVQRADEIYGEQSWMGTNFKNFFTTNVPKLPIDQHEVVAMVAPRPILVLEGTGDSWNCPTCVYHCMKYAQMVYEALGIPDYIGFSHPDHGHCGASSNATSKDYFKAFCERFLLEKSTSTTGLFKDSFTFDKAKWQDGEVPTLEGTLPPATYDKE